MEEDSKEASAGFDAENVRPFLDRLSRLIDAGFGEPQIAAIIALLQRLPAGAEESLEFPLAYQGQQTTLRTSIFMDAIDAPDVYFFTEPTLAAVIQAEMARYLEELGR